MKNINFDDSNISINDIIYLFVDGEATETEKYTMFKALAEDSALQNELQDALLLKKTAPAVADFSEPPAVLTSGIMKAVGYASGGAAAVTVAGGSSFMGNLIKNSIFQSIASGITGAFIVLSSMMLLTNENKPVSEIIPKTEPVKNENLAADIIKKPEISSIKTDTIIKYVYIKNKNIDAEINRNEAAKTIDTVNNIENEKNDLALITQTDIIENSFRPVQIQNIEKKEIHPEEEYTSVNDYETEEDINNFSVELSGIQTLVLYPNRDEFNINESFKNMSGAVYYNFSKKNNHRIWKKLYSITSVGLIAGRETFPIWVEDDKGILSARNSISWYGATLKSKFDLLQNSFKFYPYAQMTAAGTQIGPFGKINIGMGWMPDSRVTFYLGLESSFLLHSYHSIDERSEKIGLTYGVSVGF